LIEKNGGHPSSALSANRFLIIGEDPGSKLRKAKSLEVKTITYPELLKLIEERQATRLF